MIDTSLGLVLVVTGLVAWERRPSVRTGPLLVASGALWSVGAYAPSGLMPFALLGFAFERYYDVVFAYLTLTFPDRRLARSGPRRPRPPCGCLRRAVGVPAVRGLQLHRDGQPGRPGQNDRLFEALQVATSSVIVVAALGVAALALLRLRRARPVGRRILRPVVAAGALAAVVAAYDAFELVVFVRTGQGLLTFEEPWGEVASWTIISLVVLVALGFLAGTLRMRIGHGVVARMAAQLDSVDDPARFEVALREALGDPDLELRLVDQAGGWVDVTGHPADPPDDQPDVDRVATVLAGPEGLLGAIVHDRSLNEDTGLMAATVSVMRFALENARLTATVRAQLEEVRASRTRLVAAGEAERRRIERDLHDGAQQRLIGVTLTLQQAREQARLAHPDAPYVELLDDASDELLAAVDELRELARGIHPAILTEVGLRPAVAGLARRSAVPVDLQRRARGPVGARCRGRGVLHRGRGADQRDPALRGAPRGGAHRTPRRPPAGPGERRRRRRRRRIARDRAGGDQRPAGRDLGRLVGRQPARRRHQAASGDPVRVIVADDSAVIRVGVVRILSDAGMDVVAEARTADELLALVAEHRPDLAVVDIRMPPGGNAGLRAATRIRDEYGGAVKILVLSQYLEPDYALSLLEAGVGGVGYLLKDRVADSHSCSRPRSGSARAARPSIPPWSASWCAPGAASTGSPG